MKNVEIFNKYPMVDAVWVTKEENVQYLSGFTGDSATLFLTSDKSYLVTDSRYIEQAKSETFGYEVIDHAGKPFVTLQNLCLAHQTKSLGLEYTAISFASFCVMKKVVPDIEYANIDLDILRQVKSEEEISFIRKACLISVQALEAILDLIHPGKTENEIRVALEKAMLDFGSDKPAFDTIVASGNRSALPHGTATDKVISDGDFLTLDFGARYRGYCADITRTFVLGEATSRQRQLYQTLLEAQEYGVSLLKAGRIAADIEMDVRRFLAKYKLNQYFTHSLGHGIGKEIHEGPFLSGRDLTILESGMVITVEPGIYISGYGGLRIEDSVLVREEDPEVLTNFPKELYELK